MIIKKGKYYSIIDIGYDGTIDGLTEDDLRKLFWALARTLAPLSEETYYPQGAFNETRT